MASQIITSRVPQQGDPVELLLARLLAVQAQRVTGTALAAGTRNATTQSAIIDCTGFRCMNVYFRVTAVPGTDSIRITIRSIDPASGVSISLVAATVVNTVGTFLYSFGPGCLTAIPLPDQIRIEVTHTPNPSGNFDYSVGYCMIP